MGEERECGPAGLGAIACVRGDKRDQEERRRIVLSLREADAEEYRTATEDKLSVDVAIRIVGLSHR